MKALPRYGTIMKAVGETPLIALERFRNIHRISSTIPLAYAGRLDPMASGLLLILIGDECKIQEKYHAFDKEYQVEILLGASSDSGDVLGIITSGIVRHPTVTEVEQVLDATIGTVTLPYPHFSAKTVLGKPLHTWTLEGKLDTITIPKKTSKIYALKLLRVHTLTKSEILNTVRTKVETIPVVTEERKALGANFRRSHVHASWNQFEKRGPDSCTLITLTCIASSGTYMRSLAEFIGSTLKTSGLAYSIHRTRIGTYVPVTRKCGFWIRSFSP
jgi:tRNA pseudouridine(55) synthase